MYLKLTLSGIRESEELNPATGFEIEVKQATRTPRAGNIYLALSGNGD